MYYATLVTIGEQSTLRVFRTEKEAQAFYDKVAGAENPSYIKGEQSRAVKYLEFEELHVV